jgi:uncharacterized protein YcbK (DUF882 family)
MSALPETHASLHVRWDELACHDAAATPYPLEWRDDRLPPLLSAFELLRERCGGKAITIDSAYRTPAYNATIPGSAPLSQHTEGRALDLVPPSGVPLRAFWSIAQDVARLSAIRGLGLYVRDDGGWVHIDTRPSNIIRFWRG